MNSHASAHFFYGWRIVATVMLTQSFAVGLTSYVFGLFQEPLIVEFGVSRSTLSLGLIGQMFITAAVAPFIGRVLDRNPIRIVMVLGAASMGLSYIVMGLLSWLPAIGLLFVLGSAAGMLGLGPVPASKLVSAWFARMRGRAFGLSAVGTSIGGFIAPPLIAAAIIAWGWRGALIASGIVLLVVVPPTIWWVIHNQPSDIGLHEDGADEPPPPTGLPPGGWTFARLAHDSNFWVIGLAIGTMMAMAGSTIPNLVPIVSEFGVGAQRGALLISILSLCGIAGKLVFGTVSDRIDKRLLMWAAIAMLAIFLLILMRAPGFAGLVVGAMIFGAALGGLLPLWGALLAECYGSESLGQVMGLQSVVLMPPNLIGIFFVPWCYDSTGSYQLAFQSYLYLSAAVAVLLLFLRLPSQYAPSAAAS